MNTPRFTGRKTNGDKEQTKVLSIYVKQKCLKEQMEKTNEQTKMPKIANGDW